MSDTNTGKSGAWLFTVACLAGTAALAFVAVKADQVSDQVAFLPDTPEVQRFLEINRRYNNFNTVLIGVETGDILAPAALTKLRDLADAASKVAGVSALSAITTLPEMSSSDDGVVVRPLVEEIPKNAAEAAVLKARIMKTRQMVGELVSADFTSALIPVMMYGDKTAEAYPKVEKLARDAATPGFKVYFHGAPAVESFLARGGASLQNLGIAAGVAFLLLLLIGLRPRRIPAWLMVVAPAAAAGMAAPALLRMASSELTAASGLGAFVLGTMIVFSWPGPDDERQLLWWRRAVYLSCLSLVIVFVSLTRSTIVPIRGMGAGLAAMAMVVGLIAPLAMRFGGTLTGATPSATGGTAPRPSRAWLLAIVPVALALAVVVASPRPSATNDLADMFDEGADPLKAIRFLDRRFGGSEYLTVVADGDYSHPAFLRTLDRMSEAIRAVPGVSGAISPTDIFKLVNEAMIGLYRIPDTVGQMQALWFFLEGQPDLGALIYKREQGLVQIRLTPDGAKRSAEVIGAIWRIMKDAPVKIGHADLRLVSREDAARLRGRQLDVAATALGGILGGKAKARAAEVLGAIAPIELLPAGGSPDPRVNAAFRERLAAAAHAALTAYLTGPSVPMALTPAQIDELVATLLRVSEAPEQQGRAGVDRLLQAWVPGDEQAMTKMSGALQDKARDVQDKVLTAMLVEELKAAGAAGVPVTSELIAALRDFTTPYVFVDAGRDRAKTETVTTGGYDMIGYPVIAPVVARETYADLSRAALAGAAALALAAIALFVMRRKGAGAALALGLLAGLGALAWQAGWIRATAWAVNVSSFIPLAVALCAASGVWVIVAGGARRVRDVLWAAALAGAPLLVMTLSGFAPVRTVMGLSVAGIAGAAVAAALAAGYVRHSINE